MSTLSCSTIVDFRAPSAPKPPRSGLSFLVPQRTNRCNRNSTGEVFTGHALREGSRLQPSVLDRMVNGLQQRSDSRCERLGWEANRLLLSGRNPPVW